MEIPKMSARWTFAVSMIAGLVLSSPLTAAEYNGTLSTVPLDVDVYDKPGGEGTKRPQFLKGGSQVYLQQEVDNWCKVAGDAVPGDVGWIWCGMGDDNQDYSLKPVSDGGSPDTDGNQPPKPEEPKPDDKPADKPADKNALLGAHNAFRDKHCAPAMTWSNNLASSAQQWANGCKMEGNVFTHGSSGENLFWSSPPGGQGDSAVTAAWYSEVGKYNFANPGFSASTGHFTQVVWAGSTQLGCAKAVCGNFDYWVCRYAPAGNITGQFPANVKPVCK